MIKAAAAGHSEAMPEVRVAIDDGPPREAQAAAEPAPVGRLRVLVDLHYDFIWRSLRRLGVMHGDVDDAAQQVFLTASRKLAAIRPGSERSFLFQTALRVASDHRRSHRRRREVAAIEEDAPITDDGPYGEELLDLQRARQRLDEILDGLSLELRAVFVLFELDQMTMAEIAEILGLRPGTVASRLRRARVAFRERARTFSDDHTTRGAP